MLSKNTKRQICAHWQFYVIIALPMLYFIVFKYVPMYGILLAFKKYRISKGIWGSPWVGFAQFVKFFSNPSALQIMWNTFILSMYALFASIPIAVIMALALNETQNRLWRKSVQMVTYAPYFISTVVMVSILMQFMDPALGLFNVIRAEFGLEPLNFMGNRNFSGISMSGRPYGRIPVIMPLFILRRLPPSIPDCMKLRV